MSFVISILSACGGGSGDEPIKQVTSLQYKGVVQKGPFEIDTVVVLSQLDSAGIPTGDTIQTKVHDKNGHFSFEIPDYWDDDKSKFIKITAEGFYFDEAKGEKSNKKSTISSITNDPNLNAVNLISHWSAKRAEALLQEGKTLESALQQSQKELSEIFGIENSNQLDLSQNQNLTEDNALLLLLSGSLMEVAKQHTSNPQQIIDEIARDFSDDGKLSGLGDDWFIRMQAKIRDNPSAHIDSYAKTLKAKRDLEATAREDLPEVIKQVIRPSAILPEEITVEPGETVVLDGSESHDNPIENEGRLINYTWFRVDQQNFDIPFSDRFVPNPSITVPNVETELLFAIVVTNQQKSTDTAVIKVIVKKPPTENTPPVADSQLIVDGNGVSTNEDTSIAITLTGSDFDNDPLTFVMADRPLSLPHGVIEGTPPDLIYRPDSNYFGSESFTFHVYDGFEDSNTATVEITVASVNDAPTAQDQTYNIVVGGSIAETKVTLEGNDPDGINNNLIYEIVTLPSNGNLVLTGTDIGIGVGVISDKSFDYTPANQNVPQSDSFTYRVQDEGGLFSSVKKVDLTAPVVVNNAPVANDITLYINQDVASTVALAGTDSDVGDVVTVVGSSIPTSAGGLVTESGGIFTYTPNFGFYGTDTFTYKVTDGVDESNSATVTIHVNGKPTAHAGLAQVLPSFNTSTGSGTIRQTQITLDGSSSSDPEDSTVDYNWTQSSGPISVDPIDSIKNPVIDIISTTNIVGEYIFELVVTDKNTQPSPLSSDPSLVKITVLGHLELPPKAIAKTSSSSVNSGESITLDASDSDTRPTAGGTLTYLWTQIEGPSVSGSTIFSSTLEQPVIFAPMVSTPTDIEFSLVVNDGTYDSSTVSVIITVYPAPTCNAPIATTGIDRSVIADSVVILYGSGNPDICTGENDITEYTWEQVENSAGDPLTTVPLGLVNSFGSSRATFTAPSISIGTLDLYFSLVVTDYDYNDDTGLHSDPDIVKISVLPTGSTINNIAPTANDIDIIIDGFGYSKNILLTGDDPDGDNIALTYRIESSPTNAGGTLGTLNQSEYGVGSILYSPEYPVVVSSSFEYVAIDQYGEESLPALVTITLKIPVGTNSDPIAYDDTKTVNTPYISYKYTFINPLEPDGDDFIIKKVGVIESGLQFLTPSYSPHSGWTMQVVPSSPPIMNATGTFSYEVVDEYGNTSGTKIIIINFTP